MGRSVIFFLASLIHVFCHAGLLASSSEESFKKLIAGNNDYLAGDFYRIDRKGESKLRTRLKNYGQQPIAAVLTCSDSRVSVERVFNVGLGGIFVVKTAGNIIGKSQIASLEYAVSHLHVPLVVILGHTHCGMSEILLSSTEEIGALGDVMQDLRPLVALLKNRHRADTAYALTKKLTDIAKQSLEQSPIISGEVSSGKLKIIRGIYDIETGQIQFLDGLD